MVASPSSTSREFTIRNMLAFFAAGLRLSDGRELPADLVVDASGRSSATPAWLAAAGFDKPPEVSVSANLGYGTCVYDIPEWGQVRQHRLLHLGASIWSSELTPDCPELTTTYWLQHQATSQPAPWNVTRGCQVLYVRRPQQADHES